MTNPPKLPSKSKKVVTRGAMLVGAAGLFLFIVGVKRRHRLDAEREIGYGRRDEAVDDDRGDARD